MLFHEPRGHITRSNETLFQFLFGYDSAVKYMTNVRSAGFAENTDAALTKIGVPKIYGLLSSPGTARMAKIIKDKTEL